MAESSIPKNIATISLGVLKIVGTFVSLFIIERFGRKILLLVGAVMMTISLLVMALYFQFIEHTESIRFIPMVAIGTFVFFFSIGLGPMAYVFLGELFSIRAKVLAAPLGQTVNFLMSFGIVKLVVVLRETSLGYAAVFYFFGGFAAVSILFMIFVVKETKGKSLIQIQEMLRK